MKATVSLLSAAFLCSKQVAIEGFAGSERVRFGSSLVTSSSSKRSTTSWSSSVGILLHAEGGGGLFGDGTRKNERKSQRTETSDDEQFAMGEELKKLRSDVEALKENLQWAKEMNDEERCDELMKSIECFEERDPDLAYSRALQLIAETKAASDISEENKDALLEKWQAKARAARSILPQFQLEGLWVGSYISHGQELVNVSYVGDTLIATKVTGDVNVPRNEVTFTAELGNHSALEPLKLSLNSNQPSSTSATRLQRYPGKGQVAKAGFRDSKFIDGQLVMFEHHFTFVWLETQHHVLFRRPTAEQTISLLRDTISKEDELENMRDHLNRCFEMDMTDCLARQYQADDMGIEPFRRISLQEDLKLLDEQLLEQSKSSRHFNFWHVHKWHKYFDGALRGDGKEEQS